MMKHIKKILIALLVLGFGVGLFFYVRYQIRVYNTLILLSQKIVVMDSFLGQTFPTEIKQFWESEKAKNTNTTTSTPLPINLNNNKQ